MLQAFIDDSGNLGDSPVCVLAGYVARVPVWEQFTDEWEAELAKPKAVDCFKMAHAVSQNGKFAGFTRDEVDAKIVSLTEVLGRHALAGVVSIVPSDHYRRIFTGKFNPNLFDRPYYLPFYGIMVGLMRYLKARGIEEPIDFIFDDDADHIRVVNSWNLFVSAVPDEMKPFIGSKPIHRSETIYRPLQAADMLAWDVRRHFHEWEKDRDYQSRVMGLIPHVEHVQDLWDEQRLKEVATALAARQLAEGFKMTLPDPTSPLWFWRGQSF
jgi:hypothetical protein